jgi:mono/diheme cytochrome c family protein
MKTKVCLFALGALLLLSASVVADEATDKYKPLMQDGARANGAMQKAVQSDLSAAAEAAGNEQAAFAKIEAYWMKMNTSDAVDFAKNVQTLAKEVQDAATAGNKEAAVAAAQKIGANCAGCHMAHRTRLDDGTFQLKP